MHFVRKRMALLAFLTAFVSTQLKAATAVSWPPIGGTAYSVPAAGESGWANLSLYLIALQNAQGTTSQKTATRVATTTPVTVVSASDAVVVTNMGTPSAVTVNLPAGVSGQYFAIVDGKGDAATNNITIDANASQTINGALTYVINKNRAGIILSWTGTEWTVIGEYANVASTGATPNATANTIASRNSLAQSFFDGVGHTALNSAPTYSEGLMWYDNNDETMRYYNDSSTDSVNIGQELNVKIRNNSGSTITAGQVVRITGAVSGVPTVSLAQANTFATSKVFAVVTESITNNTNGYATVAGLIKNLNLSAFADGDVLYLSSSVAGGLTATRPTAPNYAIAIGNVASNSSTTGRLIVQMTAGRPIGFGTGNQVLGMNSGGTEQEYKTISGTANEIDITNGANSITIGLNSAQEFPSQTGNSGKFLTTNGTAVSWSSVSGADSTGVNYITNGNFENSSNGVQPTGWAGFTDAAAVTPADGTGGTNPPTGVTFLASTTSPLRGVLSAVLTKDANNRQGAGYSFDFTISSVDVSKKFQASLDMSVNSGTYVAGDVRVYLYDVTNSTLLTPQTVQLPGATTSFVTTVDTTTSTSYRWIVYVSSTSASAYSLKFDSMYVGPSTVVNGAAISDWQSFTPTGSWSTNTTYTGRYRRVGDTAEIMYKVSVSGAPTSANLSVNMPTGLTINTSQLVSTNTGNLYNIIGYNTVYDNGTANYTMSSSTLASSTSIFATYDNGSGNAILITQAAPITFASGDEIVMFVRVPIAEWSGSGTVNIGPGAQAEYSADDGSADVFGPNGSAVPNVGFGTSVTTRDFSFQYPQQTTQALFIELNYQGRGWQPAWVYPFSAGNNSNVNNFYGIRGYWTSSTVFRIEFGNQGTRVSASNADNGASSWATEFSAGTRFRVTKSQPSSPVGFGLASATQSGIVDPYNTSNGVVYSGRYTPTITASTNTSITTTYSSHYTRVGNIVTASVATDITCTTAANTASRFFVTLPVASNLTAFADLIGSGSRGASSGTAYAPVQLSADSTNDRVSVDFNCTQTGLATTSMTFQYEIK